jgi:hypothetical protein
MKRNGKESNPVIVAAKVDTARMTKRPIRVDYDEVECLLDVALERVREASASGQRQIHALAHTLRKVPA